MHFSTSFVVWCDGPHKDVRFFANCCIVLGLIRRLARCVCRVGASRKIAGKLASWQAGKLASWQAGKLASWQAGKGQGVSLVDSI
jgi:hypothetical protein